MNNTFTVRRLSEVGAVMIVTSSMLEARRARGPDAVVAIEARNHVRLPVIPISERARHPAVQTLINGEKEIALGLRLQLRPFCESASAQDRRRE